jgi:hypothetical protein
VLAGLDALDALDALGELSGAGLSGATADGPADGEADGDTLAPGRGTCRRGGSG